MLFARRAKRTLSQRVVEFTWPRQGWWRTLRYFRLRLVRMRGSPHFLAIGLAAGVFAAFVPIVGIQITLAVMIAYLLRGSVGAAALGTFVAMPATYPLIWVASYWVGKALIGTSHAYDHAAVVANADRLLGAALSGSHDEVVRSTAALWPLYHPLLVGGLALGLVAGGAAYYIARRLVARKRGQAT
ncbi:MAG: DUF2062 domain-containing protein [Hyphomicrobiaceae bacterium]|nr:MAG: DUF2062 domain-containing protein [Hyphomicrobiaceae bacterium]